MPPAQICIFGGSVGPMGGDLVLSLEPHVLLVAPTLAMALQNTQAGKKRKTAGEIGFLPRLGFSS